MFQKILIANRGEIARRIAQTCRKLGIAVATVHSEADRQALHVRDIGESVLLGAAPARDSYLHIDRVVQAARQVGADAVHPGYGFLSENAAFARALAEQGIAFIGPAPEALEAFGDKAVAKRLAVRAGLPVIPGSEDASADPEAVVRMVQQIGLPVLLKAAAGGGGKGIRVIHDLASLRDDITAAMREGLNAFGDPSLLVEKYLPDGRHVEVQILGDGKGNVLHLWERECSLQRRHQKVVEEAPALALAPGLRQAMLDAAVALGRAVRYRALGTVEFLVNGDSFHFLEVNPRLQVEHPVTEAVTQLDLVELQIRAAAGLPLDLTQADVPCQGHAIEMRVYAEDAEQGFMPSTGTLHHLALPFAQARVETGIATGAAITPHYDPMVAKLIVHASTRPLALQQARQALEATQIVGVANNLGFVQALLRSSAVVEQTPTTATIDQLLATGLLTPAPWREQAACIAAAWQLHTSRQDDSSAPAATWRSLTQWRLGAGACSQVLHPQYEVRTDGGTMEMKVDTLHGVPGRYRVGTGASRHSIDLPDGHAGPPGQPSQIVVDGLAMRLWLGRDGDQLWVSDGQHTCFAQVLPALRPDKASQSAAGSAVTAPLTGKVLEVRVQTGDIVSAGQVLLVLESMKMELRITAPCAGQVQGLGIRAGDAVERGAVLAHIEAVKETA